MATYLFTWNPSNWDWVDLASDAAKVTAGELVTNFWNTQTLTPVEPNSDFFLLGQGADESYRGIMGYGSVTSQEPYKRAHWDESKAKAGETVFYLDIVWDSLLDPRTDGILPHSELTKIGGNWKPRGSGTRIHDRSVVEQLKKQWKVRVASVTDLFEQQMCAVEGKREWQFILHRKRERRFRDAKIQEVLRKTGRLACEVRGCGFDFEEVYGELGESYAHVHHTKPLGSRDGPEQTILSELAIVCPNCHAMIHKDGECRDLQTLISKYK